MAGSNDINSKGCDVEIRVSDAQNNPIIGGSILLFKDISDGKNVVLNDGLVGEIKQGVCVFKNLTADEYICIFPYQIHQAAGGIYYPACAIEVAKNQRNSSVDFVFDSKTLVKIQSEDGQTISHAEVGDVGVIQFSNVAAGGVIELEDHKWRKLSDGKFEIKLSDIGVNKFYSNITFAPQPDPKAKKIYWIDDDASESETVFSLPASVQPLRMEFINEIEVADLQATPVRAQNFTVSHARRITEPSEPMGFFVHLLNSSKSIEFTAYQKFINKVLCAGDTSEIPTSHQNKLNRMTQELSGFGFGVGTYELLKTATEAFLLLRGCITPAHNGNNGFPLHKNLDLGDYSRVPRAKWTNLFRQYLGDNRLPYINRVIETALPEYDIPENDGNGEDHRFCTDILIRSRVNNPSFMELIWSYWHEEGMLVQTINAVSRRFQNLRAPGARDPLAHIEIDPLRPLNNIFWGYVEEERDRLSVKRRAYEYQHQYGLELYGKAVSSLRPADNRSKFLEAFHNLLNKCADYFRAKQDTTVDPDGYPMLHAIQELNLILAHGAHNQFGDLAWTSRVEMLMQEWILARPEIRDFLQSRIMVPHKESWMPQVDTMKTLQGWSDVPVTHFRDLGVLGEQILLTIRWHNWYDVTSEDEAKGWADLLRSQIQSYIHAYRAVTGVDLSATENVDFTMPSVLLRKRLAMQNASR